ncbi:MAG: aldo/keto reductase [Sphaerochaetaceae bacterium]|nr:aldo/keto reductase [Sphaerochaetaceae bacterium]MDC7246984.1 aldo/keto reductase [Sphaerochaetaceae bacterium]
MKKRILGKTGLEVSQVGLGTWAIGAGWGKVDDNEALKAIQTAADNGVNFFDTADVYGDGRSERFLASMFEGRKDIYIATKAGRNLNPHIASMYTPDNIRSYILKSIERLKVSSLDLLQLHCPPTDVYYNPELFGALDDMVEEGLIRHYGVSVEKIEEALKAIEYPGVETVQIIFNMFRQRPNELFFREAKKKNIGIIVRVPLASGLLTGKMTKETIFAKDDHRNFNRDGSAFDRGETFAGVRYEEGLQAVEELRAIIPEGLTMAQFALRWILMFDEVSTVIPGAKNSSQVLDNLAASEAAPLSDAVMNKVDRIYDTYIKKDVHLRW